MDLETLSPAPNMQKHDKLPYNPRKLRVAEVCPTSAAFDRLMLKVLTPIH